MNLKIKDIIKCTNGFLVAGSLEKECENFLRDSRKIQKGDTYIALKGKNFDGNTFWKEAFENGADTVIMEKIELNNDDIQKYNDKNIIQVEDTKKAIKQIAIAKRDLYKNLIVVGVTGSVGKTSTKDIIANVLSKKFNTLKTEGNNNNDIGVPLTILKLKNHDVAVIEMGMNHLGEISELSKIAKPSISVITNVGTSHIGNLGSRENILKAKLEILDGMEKKKIVINNDNDLLHLWKNDNVEIHTFGVENISECMAKDIEKKSDSISFKCDINGEFIKIYVPIGGDVFVLNALSAITVGKMLGLTNEQIQEGISTIELTKKRMEIINCKNDVKIINDTYNASLDSMKAAIKYLSEINGKRKIAVLGDMFELGEYTEELHKKVGEEIVNNKIDKLYLIGENVKFIKEEAKNKGFNSVLYFNSSEELLEKLEADIISGDVILFKASNGMKLYDMVEKLKMYLEV